MSVTRIGLMLQPAWVRTATAVAETSSTFLGSTQTLLQQTVATAREAWNRQLIGIFVALLTPASAIVLVLGLWRVTADLAWTETFPIQTGFFSHWQVWIALAIALKLFGTILAARASRKHDISHVNPPVF